LTFLTQKFDIAVLLRNRYSEYADFSGQMPLEKRLIPTQWAKTMELTGINSEKGRGVPFFSGRGMLVVNLGKMGKN
jgi:hypothetical protein